MSKIQVLKNEIVFDFEAPVVSGGNTGGGTSGGGGSSSGGSGGSGGSSGGGSSSGGGALLDKTALMTALRNADNNGMTSVVFSKTNPNIDGTPTVVSASGDKTCLDTAYAIEDSASKTLYIYPIKDNVEIYAPEDSSKLLYYDNMNMGFGFYNLSNLDLTNLNTSRVTNMSFMLAYWSRATVLDVSRFDTSNVTDMSYMFDACSAVKVLDVSHFDTSKVINMNTMFFNCAALSSLDVTNFDTTKVTDMGWMFGLTQFTSIDLSHFDTSKVTDMSSMFTGCDKLTSLDLSHFDTSNVTDMSDMFSRISFSPLDLSNFVISKDTKLDSIFSYVKATIYLKDEDTINIVKAGKPTWYSNCTFVAGSPT